MTSQASPSQHGSQREKGVLSAIARCRTVALGGHHDQCSGCGHIAIFYNSCRNQHCPRCQGNARIRWLMAELDMIYRLITRVLIFLLILHGSLRLKWGPVSGRGISPAVPLPQWNPSALALIEQLLPINPALDPSNCGHVSYAIPNVSSDNEFDTRVDYTINQKDNLYIR